MRKLLFLFVCVFSVGLVSAQDQLFEKYNVSRVSSGLETGFGMSSNKSYYSYLAPHINFQVSPRLKISTSIIFMNMQMNNAVILTDNGLKQTNLNSNQTYIYNQAQYSVNERLKITGEILYGTNNQSKSLNTNNKMNPSFYSIGAEYKVNDALQIGIQIRGSNNEALRNNPYGNSTMFSNPGF